MCKNIKLTVLCLIDRHECLNMGGMEKMDAIKLMSQDSLKAEKPVFEIGDTIL